ncbi:MAG: hypothetical protein GX604_01255 [Actinobacteria bacterium]|nr:hypothetical protein [Actinomycetota bacterium]
MAAMEHQSAPPAIRTPARTEQQRLEALARANAVRTQRSQLKIRLKNGEERLEDILLSPPDYVHTAKVLELLMALPQVGPVRAGRILEACRVSASKTVIGLTPRQRTELLTHIQD